MTSKVQHIMPVKDGFWSGRIDSANDESQFRLHQVVKCSPEFNQLKKEHVAIIGFASDEGVRRNKGRVGASDGPDYFRKSIGSLCYHGEKDSFFDLGNIEVAGQNLEKAQSNLAEAIEQLLAAKAKPFVIGGGHETAFGHLMGILNHLKKTEAEFSLGILNIDAHLDMRAYDSGAHSGSWALQVFDYCNEQNLRLGYHAFGLNEDNNTRFLLDKARSMGASWTTNSHVLTSLDSSLDRVKAFIEKQTHIYCTVCLDVFDASIAPGVSAPAWNGIRIQDALSVLKVTQESGKLISMDVCELNPFFDKEGKTARVAGSLFNAYLKGSTA